jgi:hypothetical protein
MRARLEARAAAIVDSAVRKAITDRASRCITHSMLQLRYTSERGFDRFFSIRRLPCGFEAERNFPVNSLYFSVDNSSLLLILSFCLFAILIRCNIRPN